MTYIQPKYELEKIESEDVILASGGNVTEDGIGGEEIPLFPQG